jgi:SAM-dependent methyltransferase
MTVYAPDGSPVEAFAALPHGPAPQLLHGALPPNARVLDLGGGAGRIAHALADRGHAVTLVDQCQAMLDHVDAGIEAHLADIEGLDLARRYDGVLLASFLVNTTDPEQRDAFLATCARHVEPTGAVFVQRLDPELVPGAVDAESAEGGVTYSMSDVQHDGSRFEATISFAIDNERWEHRYAGEVLHDEAVAAALGRHGLLVTRYLDAQRTWVEARPA